LKLAVALVLIIFYDMQDVSVVCPILKPKVTGASAILDLRPANIF